MEPEDLEDLIRRGEERFQQELQEERIKEFKEACEEGYQMLENHGTECIPKEDGIESARRALDKMLGYFISLEEYEKCSKIKSVYLEAFKKEPEPETPNFL